MDFISTDMFIGSYWAQRKESREEAASRLVEFLKLIARHERFASWYESADRRSPASRSPFSINMATITKTLKTNHDDAAGKLIPELGYSLALLTWESASGGILFSTLVGSYHPRIQNNALLRLGSIPITEDVARAVFQDMIRVFEPEHTMITSHDILDKANAEDPWQAGWLIDERGKGMMSTG